MDDGALDHALESGRRLGVVIAVIDQVLQLALEIGGQTAPQLVQIYITCPHHRGGILVVDQRQQEMLQRGILVMALIGQRQCAVEGLL